MLIEAVHQYLAVRRATGYRLKEPESHLRSFAEFATRRGDSLIRTQTVVDWCCLSSAVGQRQRRLQDVVRFARYLQAEQGQHEVPPGDVFGRRKPRPAPFIFTHQEIDLLLQAARRLRPQDSLRPHTYTTLFALLRVTGLRVSEALKLRLNDLTTDGLVIRHTKFKKSRLLPLHETTQAALARYLRLRRLCITDDDHLFISDLGEPLTYVSVYFVFRRLVRTIGLNRASGRRRPRLHDFRHTFAVRALEACPEDRDSVGQHMLALSTYLGHSDISHTYWYLQATPHLMRDIADACEDFSKAGSP